MSYDQIAWLPLCAGITGVGLVLSFLTMRRRGAAAGLRVMAWALLPVAAYLTGALPTLWQIGTAIAGFVAGVAFNPMVWAGVGVAGLSVLLFLISGFLRGRRLRAAAASSAGSTGSAISASSSPARSVPSSSSGTALPGATAVTQPLPKRTPKGQTSPAASSASPASPASPAAPAAPAARPGAPRHAAQPAADDDFSDIEDILKRRGIG
ncbi:cellulose synthase [Streptosporangium longisporum]|uniref:Cellulose synthase n=1 Tax=Streptosporangium longisporum TaxID=46187 RepID=A0ABP6L4Y8_9ACTN